MNEKIVLIDPSDAEILRCQEKGWYVSYRAQEHTNYGLDSYHGGFVRETHMRVVLERPRQPQASRYGAYPSPEIRARIDDDVDEDEEDEDESEEDQDMADKTDKTDTSKPAALTRILTDGAELAGGLAAAEQVNVASVGLLTAAAIKMGIPEEMLNLPAVQALLRLLAPFAVSMAARSVPAMAKHADVIDRGCTLALAVEFGKVLGPAMGELKHHIEAVVQAAAQVDAPTPFMGR